jgi:hypothetical protein
MKRGPLYSEPGNETTLADAGKPRQPWPSYAADAVYEIAEGPVQMKPDLTKCDWYRADDEGEPCWGEINSCSDAYPDGDGSDYPVTAHYCQGHVNFALFEDEGYVPEPK